jgi:hypothetical protein
VITTKGQKVEIPRAGSSVKVVGHNRRVKELGSAVCDERTFQEVGPLEISKWGAPGLAVVARPGKFEIP